MKSYGFLAACLGLWLGFSPSAQAQETPWRSADYVRARLVSAVTGTGSGGTIAAGLELQLEDGWHAYWRMPGDGGLPPSLNWDRSVNIVSVTPYWPAPRRFEDAGLNSFGYEGHILMPLTAHATEPGEAVMLGLDADIMVCKTICVPQKISIDLAIPSGAADPSPAAALIEKAKESVPQGGDHPALKIESMVIGPDALVVRAFSQHGYDGVDLFAETGDVYLTAPPEIMPDEKDARYATLRIAKPDGVDNLAKALMNRTVRLTLINGDNAIEKSFSL